MIPLKRSLIILTMLAALLLSACGGSAPEVSGEPAVGIPNPIHETDEAGLAEATGISLPAPEFASDVSWSYIDLTGEPPIAQMNFTLGGKQALLRAQATEKTDVSELSDISGLYYDWNTSAEDEVAYCRAMIHTNGEAGYITWLDVVPGVQYCLGMTEGADVLELVRLANAVFVPLQGDA